MRFFLAIKFPDASMRELADSETPPILVTKNVDQSNITMGPMYIDQEHEMYSNMLDSASKTAHNITHNMDQLWANVESLASQICLDFLGSDSKEKYNSDFLKTPSKQTKSRLLDHGSESMFHDNSNPFMPAFGDVHGSKVVVDQPRASSNFMNIPLEPGVMSPTMLTGNVILDDTFKKDEQKYKKNTQNKLFFINHRPSTVFYK
jgi:hypothetical protein